MKNPYNMKIKIKTLTVSSNRPFIEKELNYLKAFSYCIDQFNKIDDEINVFCLYLGNGNFIIGDHTDGKTINPFVFVNKNGNLSFDIDISCFNREIQEFQKYIDYNGSKGERKYWPETKKLIAAIKEYKNDFLDFKIHNNLIARQIIEQARQLYEEQETEENLDI